MNAIIRCSCSVPLLRELVHVCSDSPDSVDCLQRDGRIESRLDDEYVGSGRECQPRRCRSHGEQEDGGVRIRLELLQRLLALRQRVVTEQHLEFDALRDQRLLNAVHRTAELREDQRLR